MTIKGSVLAFNVSKTKGVPKSEVDAVTFVADSGIEGDAHAAPGIKQVSLLAVESADKIRDKVPGLCNGRFAENITTQGLILYELPIGTQLLFGGTVLMEVSQIGKTCHTGCAIKQLVGDCVMPREGIFCKILTGGRLEKGCSIEVL